MIATRYRELAAWGKHRENGVWLHTVRRRRLRWRGADCLFIAAGRLRVRLMKPW